MWYSRDQEPVPFAEETSHPSLFDRRAEKGADWEIAFYRSVSRADGVILIGGGNSTKISGQVAIGTRMAILTLAEFGGAASKVWETLSAGEDLPTREEINLMTRPWSSGAASACVDTLFAQHERRWAAQNAPQPILSIVAALLFLLALAIVPWMWGQGALTVWMLFLAPLLAGGAGAAIRPVIDRTRSARAVFATVILGLIAGGIAGVLFVTAQLSGNPAIGDLSQIADYARRSIPFAIGVGFVAGLTSDAVFGKLLAMDVVRSSGIVTNASHANVGG